MSSGNIVKLNIGGTLFQTSKSTLTKFDGFFKTMLETGVPIAKDESGAIFIDRSARHFDSILDYMRDARLDLPTSSDDVKKIQNEAQYYLLDGLVELCRVELQERAEKSANLESDIRVLENHSEYLQVIAEPVKPTLIIYFSIRIEVLSYKPRGFCIHPFLREYKNKLDIFFRPFDTNQPEFVITSWPFSLHWKEANVYEYFSRYKMDGPFETRLKNSIQKFFEYCNIP